MSKKLVAKRILALILSILVAMGTFPMAAFADAINALAEPIYQVKIVSFNGANNTDPSANDSVNLRSSTLLEARLYVSYDNGTTWGPADKYGDTPITQLNYTWKNEIKTYLYVYNSHNMYGINNTAGEQEIYPNGVNASSNMSGRTHKITYSGDGFAWASIYGANLTNKKLAGSISVTVKDKNGNIIGSDSHEGEEIKYSGNVGIIAPSLDADIKEQSIAFGIFEGDKRSILDLFGEAGIVHVGCTASSVTKASVESGEEYISLKTNPYTVEGKKPGTNNTNQGDARLSITIKKDNCKFHNKSSGTTEVPVYVYKKPKTTTTATTLTLTNLDDRCKYYIDGVEGRKVVEGETEYIIFEGLTPNTNYTVEVKGQTSNTDPAYAYVYDKTKPAYRGIINVLVNNYGETTPVHRDITDIYSQGKLVFRLADDLGNIETERTGEGVYTATLSQGVFYPWLSTDGGIKYTQGKQQLVVTDGDVQSSIHFYEVEYDFAGGSSATIATSSIHILGSSVSVTSDVPTKDGYVFDGWVDQNGKTYNPGDELTHEVNKAYRLTAQWIDAVDVYVNVKINHLVDDNNIGAGWDRDPDKDDISMQLVSAPDASKPYLETGHSITITDTSHSKHDYTWEILNGDGVNDAKTTTYTAKVNMPTFGNLTSEAIYTVVTSKHGYDVTSITNTKKSNGDWVIDVELRYAPTNEDLEFEVKVDNSVPENLAPQAAIVKVLYWDTGEGCWKIITQQEGMNPGVRVDLVSNGSEISGKGSYPVWIYENTDIPYGYRIMISSLVYPDGQIVPVDNALTEIENNENATPIYSIKFGDVSGGQSYPPGTTGLRGAYFEEENGNIVQKGYLDAVITAEGYTVTFDAQGGTVNKKDIEVLTNQFKVPSFYGYTPVREGGYIFDGWYKDLSFTTPGVEGELLEDNLTLYAKWKNPLKVAGTVTISGTYLLDGQTIEIPEVARATEVTVALQRVVNGNTTIIDSKNVAITYNGSNLGTGTYLFDEVPDTGYEYNVVVVSTNYNCKYRNEPESLIYSSNVNDYNAEDNNAEFGENDPTKAVVDAYLTFMPQNFDLKYKVDATSIGEGFRPNSTEMLILYDDGASGVNPKYWPVISQMSEGGQIVTLADSGVEEGKGKASYPVWISKPDGTFYDYSIALKKYNDKTYDVEETPFHVLEIGSTSYDPVKGQTRELVAILEPKVYNVIFDLNFVQTETDNVGTSMEEYEVDIDDEQKYVMSHTWSYSTDIEAKPERTGYVFKGWFIDKDSDKKKDADEAYVSKIAAAVHEDVILTAEWEEVPDVYVNVIIDHMGPDNGQNNDPHRHDVVFTVDQKSNDGQGDFAEVLRKEIKWDGKNSFNVDGYEAERITNADEDKTVYTATKPTYNAIIPNMIYTATANKSSYSTTVTESKDSDGNIILTINLKYDPNNFDFTYSVRLDDAAKALPSYAKPVAVNTKVTSWFDYPNGESKVAWYTITQMENTYERVELDNNGEGIGSYPVWKTLSDGTTPYYYRMEVVSYELADGTIVPVNNLNTNQPSISDTYTTEGGVFTAKVNTTDCTKPDEHDLKGAYCDSSTGNDVQKGEVEAVISIATHTLTINPNGGKFGDDSTEIKTITNLVQMPDISGFEPVCDGYIFDGWTWTPNSVVEEGELLTNDVTITAKWRAEEYTITYIPNGGQLPPSTQNPRVYGIEDSFEHPIPTRENYTFLGWYSDVSLADEFKVDNVFAAGQTGDKVLYAKWQKDLVSLTITKSISSGECYSGQAFVFHVKGNGIDLRVPVKFDEGNSVTISNLPKGIYQVTEETGWSWRYSPEGGETVTVDLTSSNGSVTFVNLGNAKVDRWISAFDRKCNVFNDTEGDSV